jgi:hypothetical protein
MATKTPEFRVDGRPVDGAGEIVESFGLAAHGRAPRWTTAHTEAARFIGECVGTGAVLGMVAAATCFRREERHAG